MKIWLALWHPPHRNELEKLSKPNWMLESREWTKNDTQYIQLATGGKPSTWFPPGRLVELKKIIYNDENMFARRFWMMIFSHTYVYRHMKPANASIAISLKCEGSVRMPLSDLHKNHKQTKKQHWYYIHRPRQGNTFAFKYSAATPASYQKTWNAMEIKPPDGR